MRLIVGNVEHNIRVAACMSVPRLGFMDNFFTAHAALVPHGIHLIKGTGAFWDQTISNVLTEVINDEQNFDYVLTLDYDSVFEPSCLTKLMSTMLVSGVDAIAPLQTKRDDKHLMFTPEGFAGQEGNQITLPNSWWEQPCQPCETLHFGLTLLRCSALRKMTKPWFLGVPGPDGDWQDGRVDPDIYFWRKWREEGFSMGVCPQVAIGHAELVVTWPDQKLKGIHQYPTHYWNDGGRRPPEAWGSEDHARKSIGDA
jgi:hypothetical protein